MSAIFGNKKLMKMLIGALVGGLLVVGAGIYLMSSKESTDPKVIEAKEEQRKQDTGYYLRLAELQDMLPGKNEFDAQQALDKFFDETGIDKLNSIEKMPKGQGDGNYLFKSDYYDFDVTIYSKQLTKVKIGKITLYTNIVKDSDLYVGAANKVMPYSEYDTAVKILSKAMDITMESAADNYELLTSFDILSLTKIKKYKEDGKTGYLGYFGTTPIKMFLTGELITYISVDADVVDEVVIYDASNSESNSIMEVLPLLGERTGIVDALMLTVPIAMKTKSSIVFPVALKTGDDSWLMIKSGDIIYIETDGDIKTGDKMDRKHFIIKLNAETRETVYLKVGNKIYVDTMGAG